MAFTQPCYELDAPSGRSAIYLVDPLNPGDRAPFLFPLQHLNRVLFHSDLKYLEVAYDRTVTITQPALPANSYRNSDPVNTTMPAHGLPFVPYCQPLVKVNAGPWENLMPHHPVQIVGRSDRFLSAIVNINTISLNLWTLKAYEDAMPAISVQVRVVIIRPARAILADAFIIDAQNKRIMFGRGTLDNQGSKRVYLTAGPASFKIPRLGGSMDTFAGGLRVVSSTGAVRDYNLYAGGYRGSGFDGIGIT